MYHEVLNQNKRECKYCQLEAVRKNLKRKSARHWLIKKKKAKLDHISKITQEKIMTYGCLALFSLLSRSCSYILRSLQYFKKTVCEETKSSFASQPEEFYAQGSTVYQIHDLDDEWGGY